MELDGFNADEIPPAQSFEALPNGWYQGMVIESEEKPTKAGDGSYLQLTIEVIDGPHKGRKLWDRLNLNNPNATAVEIAQRTLSALCHAVGVLHPKESEDLHEKPFGFLVGSKPYNGETRNEVKGYRALAASGSGKSSSAPAGAAKGAPKGAAKPSAPPWQRKAG